MSGAQATGALAANNPTATVVVAIPPPPREREGDGGGGGGGGHRGISQTTEHLLIAAGSIGATIIIVMAVLAIYTIRKRGVSLTQTIKQRKIQVPRRGPPPPLKFQGECAAKQSFSNDYGALRTHTVTPPPAAIARSGSSLSQCPSTGPNRNDSFNLQSHRKPSADMVGSTFLLESPPLPRCNNSHRRDPSATPSSPILGQQDLRRSASTHNTRSVEDDASELRYGDTSQERAQSPLPPPPTFKQFLNNRPSISGKSGFGGMTSRFSWTNSNAPQTPHEPNRDTYQAGRESYMTTRSSVHRFRTVDSWVNQQSNRIEAQKLREQFRLTSTSTVYSGDDENDHVPKVPAMPKNVEQLREYSAPMSASLPLRAPLTPPLPISKSLPGRNIRHERRDSRTTIDTAPIFKHHPGTEVRFSTRSAVPSEILDRGRIPNVLS
ncbi:hypothetical protein BU23DRAFT_188335 [Bimuria novae-zelandiae CBS 107.79]|uniref:Uncharacterized protein n=1 Tax=Bimuria novae-zelandiae CBS 107.79 TaxID=1447943 RepID=A0A6A5VQE9_9PLEO|nr:hypothetical protein BU23DRAFT_188335 [Bimuria novae-zelandiae CBS 107.79]